MTTPTTSRCFPDDQDMLDGKAEIELPPERYTKVFWDVDILDLDDKNKDDKIIGAQETFQVRFRVELRGRLWKCIAGDWKFDVGFTTIGKGPGFYLSELLPNDPNLGYPNWRGCDTLCIERVVTVPGGTIQIDRDVQVFETAGLVELSCCNGGHIAVAGYEALEEYTFFKGA